MNKERRSEIEVIMRSIQMDIKRLQVIKREEIKATANLPDTIEQTDRGVTGRENAQSLHYAIQLMDLAHNNLNDILN